MTGREILDSIVITDHAFERYLERGGSSDRRQAEGDMKAAIRSGERLRKEDGWPWRGAWVDGNLYFLNRNRNMVFVGETYTEQLRIVTCFPAFLVPTAAKKRVTDLRFVLWWERQSRGLPEKIPLSRVEQIAIAAWSAANRSGDPYVEDIQEWIQTQNLSGSPA